MKEADLELEMIQAGVQRYRTNKNRLRSAGMESRTAAGRNIVEHAVAHMTEALIAWMKNAVSGKPGGRHSVVPLIGYLDPKLVSLLTCKTVIDGITSLRTINSLAMSVGRQVEDEYRFLHIRSARPKFWAKTMKVLRGLNSDKTKSLRIKHHARKAGIELPKWTPRQKAAIGLTCIELMRQSTGLIETETRVTAMGKPSTVVRATDGFLSWLEKSHQTAEFMKPVYMPMVRVPNDWGGLRGGGYQSKDLQRPLIKSRRASGHQGDMSEVYEAVNLIQRTGFRVNAWMLDALKHCYTSGLALGDLPLITEPDYPPFPPDGKTNPESRKTWRRICGRMRHERERERSRRIALHKTVMLAEKFQDKTIYYPQELDFRGRVYPKPVFLNTQGADWQRALLQFTEGQELTDEGRSWLAIHGANCWGFDKVSFRDRLDFIQKNHDLILQCAEDYVTNTWWHQADKPFGFLAFCHAYAAVARDPKALIHLPIHLDGSNNGLQLFSLLLRDPVSALATNCLPTEVPMDIYAQVADRLIEKLKATTDDFARRWLKFGIDRKTTKRVVMCLPYGLTSFSAKEYLRDWYLDKAKTVDPEFDVSEVFHALMLLSDLLWESIHEIVRSAKACMDWLREVARAHVKANKPIRWTSPSGFSVTQGYRKSTKINVKTSVGTVIRQHRFRVDRDEMAMTANMNAIAPNFIHSLDASVLTLAIRYASANGIRSFSCIHDSIGVPANQAGTMSSCIREAAIEIFSQPVLESFRKEVQIFLGSELPPPPPLGTMNLSDLREADYFFA